MLELFLEKLNMIFYPLAYFWWVIFQIVVVVGTIAMAFQILGGFLSLFDSSKTRDID